jgi:LysR family glycine cleavage system transcriptional activator
MSDRIPPIHTLKALDAFARLGTVWQAAEALGVTRSAVSHGLGLLEEILGFEVVARSGKGIALTPRGRRYAVEVRASLAALEAAQRDGARTEIEGTLRLSSTPGFAAMWLCNHIGSFSAGYPALDVHVVTGRELDDVSDGDIDAFIAFGDGNWPQREVRHLYDVDFLPLCSPALLNVRGGLAKPADLLHVPLLHLRRPDDWNRWLTLNGVAEQQSRASVTFSDMMLVQAAAMAGQGVMMGDEVTCGSALASGQLVAPFQTRIRAPGSYYLVTARQRPADPAVTAFGQWLQALIGRVGTDLRGD